MTKKCCLFLLLFICTLKTVFCQGIAINETDSLPHVSAILDISSENKGILIPRLHLTGFYDVTTVDSPARGLLVFNLNDTSMSSGFYYWDSLRWQPLSVSTGTWNTNGNDSINVNNDFIGTIDSNAIIFKTNNTERARITADGKFGVGVTSPTYKFQISQSFSMPNTSNSTTGILFKDTVRFMHNYKDASANSEQNTFLGIYSGNFSITSASNSNVGVGTYTLNSLTSGKENTATGAYAIQYSTTGMRNSSHGTFSFRNNTTSNYSTAFGYCTMNANTTGSYNSGFGMQALYTNTTGQWNSATGTQALYGNTTASYNTAIGCRAFLYNSSNYSNSTAIGYEATITGSNQVRIGNSSVNDIGGYASWSNISDARFKNNIQEDVIGLEFIKLLRPVTFNWKMNDLAGFLNEDVSIDSNGVFVHIQPSPELQAARNLKANKKISGFIAQEVEQAAQAVGYNFSGVIAPQNANDLYRLSYSEFVVPLVKAVQEQQLLIDNIKNDIILLKNENLNLNNIINSLGN